jgi:hypothetical protein
MAGSPPRAAGTPVGTPAGVRRWPVTVHEAWARYGGAVLAVVAAHALVTAALRLDPALEALMIIPDAAIDLLIRMDEVRRWFGGVAIYGDAHSANYPPASYSLLWPLVGWLPEAQARALYAASIFASIIAIAAVAVRMSGSMKLPETALLALVVMPLGATQITVWIGQLGLHVTACLLAAAALLVGGDRQRVARPHAGARSWSIDLVAAALLTLSLVKPTLSVPVVGAILILTSRWRPVLLTGAFYLGVTLLAAAFQDASAPGLIVQWLGRESVMNLPLGSVNSHLWLHWLGFDGSMLPVSLLWILVGAAWTWRYRDADPWIVIGVAALVARLWIHHRAFDDVILVIPMITLFRIAKSSHDVHRVVPVVAAVLFAGIYALGHAPWHWLSGEHPTLWLAAEIGRTIAWIATLAFLLWQAHRSLRTRGRVHASAA